VSAPDADAEATAQPRPSAVPAEVLEALTSTTLEFGNSAGPLAIALLHLQTLRGPCNLGLLNLCVADAVQELGKLLVETAKEACQKDDGVPLRVRLDAVAMLDLAECAAELAQFLIEEAKARGGEIAPAPESTPAQ